jgi:perosamine synthetase
VHNFIALHFDIGQPSGVDMSDQATSEPGAPAIGDGIPLCVPEIRGNEWKYVRDCLDTGWVSSAGSYVQRMERAMAERTQTLYAVATVNGTAALHTALLVAGVEPGDEVVTSTLTFIAPANSIRYVGAWPVFIDAEPEHWQMDPGKLRDFLEKECRLQDGTLVNRVSGRRVKAIMPVHILGHPVDMDPIIEMAERFRLLVIEDATESLGAKYRGKPVGSLGHIACFSFNGNKVITTGGGGMITTDNPEWAKKAKYFTTQAKDDPLEFVHGAIGYNYRLTNIAAAMGVAQLELLDEFIAAKRRIAHAYDDALRDVPGIQPMREAEWAFSIFWMYTVLVDKQEYGLDSRELIRKLAENNIQARPLWQPMHRSPAMKVCQSYKCEVAARLNGMAISIPCSVGLNAEQQHRVVDLIRSASV